MSADSAMDALTHAVEAYVASGADDFSDACAEKAIRLILAWLPQVISDPADLEARERMHNASALAAVAFENAGLGITHSLAHAIGGHLPVAHGRLNSILLPHVVAFNAGNRTKPTLTAERYWALADAVGLSPAGRLSGPTRLLAAIRQLGAMAGMPTTLTEAGVGREAVEPLINVLAEQALADGCTAFNPVRPSLDDLRAIVRAVV